MKEATGELNMTVIVVIALAAVSTLFVTVLLPLIRVNIVNSTCESQCGENNFTKADRTNYKDFTCSCTSSGASSTSR